jgi:uncharacterized iron-regulated membrane protein
MGLVLALLGLSGALLVHRDAWIMLPHAGDAYVADPVAITATVERLLADPAARPQTLVLARDGFGLHRLTYARGAGAYADQTGAVVTRWASQWERPEIWLFDFHHHLFADDAGETVVGAAGLCGMFFVVSGVILWWRTRKTFEFRLWPKRLSRPAIVRQHRDLGILVAPLLLLVVYTGAAMVFRPMTALLLGPAAPAVIARSSQAPVPTGARLAAKPAWAGMIAAARARFPDAELRTIGLPRNDGGFVVLRMKRPGEWTPNGRTMLYYAADSGRLVLARDGLALPAQAQGFNTFYPLHAAKIGGLAYRLAITVVGLALTMLGSFAVWSFWFKRPRLPARSR